MDQVYRVAGLLWQACYDWRAFSGRTPLGPVSRQIRSSFAKQVDKPVGQNEFLQALRHGPEDLPRVPPAAPPLLLVVIDTEEEFDWSQPHARDNTSVSAIAAQGLAQEVFRRHGIVPTYVIDYPVAATPAAVSALKVFADRGE